MSNFLKLKIMTNIELQTMSAVKSAAMKYVNKKDGIDWEQRRYEIAKDVLAAIVSNSVHYASNKQTYIDISVDYADLLIKKLQ